MTGDWLVVVDEVQLLAEAVEGEANNIQEVSVDVLYQHAAQGLNAVATRLVPERQTSQRGPEVPTKTLTQDNYTRYIFWSLA